MLSKVTGAPDTTRNEHDAIPAEHLHDKKIPTFAQIQICGLHERFFHRNRQSFRRLVALQRRTDVRLLRRQGRTHRIRLGGIACGRCRRRPCRTAGRHSPRPEPCARNATVRPLGALRLHHPAHAAAGQRHRIDETIRTRLENRLRRPHVPSGTAVDQPMVGHLARTAHRPSGSNKHRTGRKIRTSPKKPCPFVHHAYSHGAPFSHSLCSPDPPLRHNRSQAA